MLFSFLRPSEKIFEVRIKLSLLCLEESLLCQLKIREKALYGGKSEFLPCFPHLFGTVEEPTRVISQLLKIEVHLDLNWQLVSSL